MIHIPEDYFSNQALIDYFSTYLTKNRLAGIEQILSNRTRYVTVVLEDVFRAQNASAVLRSCECFGVQDAHFIEEKHK